MTIFGIEGGIGTGKTLTGVFLTHEDLIHGKSIFSNVMFKNLPKAQEEKITYLTKDIIKNIFEKVKKKEIDMRNSTVFIQEAHNYIDSRNAMSKQNKMIGYWILQSRHTGEGSCDIIYDTQDIKQVDIRLRRNTDFVVRLQIISWDVAGKIRKPARIYYEMFGKVGHKYQKFNRVINVKKVRELYDTYQLVDF